MVERIIILINNINRFYDFISTVFTYNNKF